MSERTCGNIDGKPCEWLGKPECERSFLKQNAEACAPVLALVEAREDESAALDVIEAREKDIHELRAEVERCRLDYGILSDDYAQLRIDVEKLRADNAVQRDALERIYAALGEVE